MRLRRHRRRQWLPEALPSLNGAKRHNPKQHRHHQRPPGLVYWHHGRQAHRQQQAASRLDRLGLLLPLALLVLAARHGRQQHLQRWVEGHDHQHRLLLERDRWLLLLLQVVARGRRCLSMLAPDQEEEVVVVYWLRSRASRKMV